MPVINSQTTSLQVHPSTNNPAEGSSEVHQQRQPTSLQGLLRFAVEATRTEDALHNTEFEPIDEEVL